MKYIMQKVNNIIEVARVDKIKLYLSVGGQEALRDVFLLLIYITSDHDKVIQATLIKKLYLVLADAVMLKKYMAIAKEIS